MEFRFVPWTIIRTGAMSGERTIQSTTIQQLLNYLCAARLTLGLLVYFSPTKQRSSE